MRGTSTTAGRDWKKVTHTFAKPGKFAVKLTVTDSKSLADSDTKEVTAKPAVEIEALEVTQAIQVFDNLITLKARLQNTGEPLVPIISGKPAVMRVYLSEVDVATTVTLTVSGVLVAAKRIDWQPLHQ
jgi:PKD repeat protein